MTISYAHKPRKLLAGALLLLAGILAAVDALSAEAEPVLVAENEGELCFRKGQGDALDVSFTPMLGCLSSTCTAPVTQNFSVAVVTDTRAARIEVRTRFAARRIGDGSRPCSDDCSGGGEGHARLWLSARPYDVVLGDKLLGTLNPALVTQAAPVCFGQSEIR